MKFLSKLIYSHSRECIWKCCQEIGSHFVPASMCYSVMNKKMIISMALHKTVTTLLTHLSYRSLALSHWFVCLLAGITIWVDDPNLPWLSSVCVHSTLHIHPGQGWVSGAAPARDPHCRSGDRWPNLNNLVSFRSMAQCKTAVTPLH